MDEDQAHKEEIDDEVEAHVRAGRGVHVNESEEPGDDDESDFELHKKPLGKHANH